MVVGLDRLLRVSRVSRRIVRHVDHGDTLLKGYRGTREPGPKNPAGFGSDPDPVAGSTRPGKPAEYPGSERRGGTPNVNCLVILIAYFPNCLALKGAWKKDPDTKGTTLLLPSYLLANEI